MTHWAEKYIGQPYVKGEKDCYYWFRHIAKEQFGRDLPPLVAPMKNQTLYAARMLNGRTGTFHGFQMVAAPTDGDAAFMTTNGQTAHHMGMVVYVDGKMHVLHALEGAGVCADDLRTLRLNNLEIICFWGVANAD